MPSLDIVSEYDRHELTNAIDQASRELDTRFDFRGIDASFKLNEKSVECIAEHDFQVEQMLLMLKTAMAKRKVDIRILADSSDTRSGKQIRRVYPIKEGIEQKYAKEIVKKIKDSKLKVQASIQGEQLRVTGKKRDDLQEVMQMLRADKSLEVPLQFTNFRD
ncbi:MAG: YajQ family cyclic di-GMP-binding protein [Hahellaceae bacterium]|nr:YajQ family cyclic di-GMP-binding protein [Hahellaceae bacterium]